MLSSLRKFSSSIYAKIFLGIIVIPFVFWGMGSSFLGGDKNIVVVIDKEKYTTEDLANFIKSFIPPNQKTNPDKIDELLSVFIGEKLIEKEVKHFGIQLSDNSLIELVKNQKNFMRDNKFSRVEYEKFLLKNNIPAFLFEINLSKEEQKKQLLDFIGGGISPSKFLVNTTYDSINQKRNIHLINLNDLYKKNIKFSEEEIISFYENNKEIFKEVYKSTKILELTPKILIDSDEFNEIFFKRVDEIDNIIVQGENLDSIIRQFELEKAKTIIFNESGKSVNPEISDIISSDLSKKIFSMTEEEPTALIESEDKYFIVEVFKTELIEKNLNDENTRKTILLNLEQKNKREFFTKILSKINQNNFTKLDFDKLSNDKNLQIKKIVLKNQNDNQTLKEDFVKKIYTSPEKKVIMIYDLGLTESLLIYVDKIENVYIDEKSEKYKKYQNLSKIKLAKSLLNTYDNYIKQKYEININYKSLDVVKNYFN